MTKIEKQYGLWPSPLSPEMLAGESRLSDVQWAADGETLVWLESRDGRGVLMVRRPGQAPRAINDKLSVKGGVGYGGGEFSVHGETVYFSAKDGRLYRAALDKGLPRAITPPWGSVAAPAVSPDGKWVAYIHRHDDVDRVAVVDAQGKAWPQIAGEGSDFYMQPAWSADGESLVWVQWDHPQMPWNGAFLERVSVTNAGEGLAFSTPEVLAGGVDVAVQQPAYSPDGKYLSYLSDESGFWQVVIRELSSGEERVISTEGREYGGPGWVQGLRFVQWTPDSKHILAISRKAGIGRLERLSLDGSPEALDIFEDYTVLGQVAVSSADNVAVIAGSSTTPTRVVSADLGAGTERVERFGSSERLADEDLSKVRPVSWPVEGGGPIESVHGLYYEPANSRFEGSGKPPALVMIHGGPTSQREARWEARNQFFASRGYAVLDVNYRGSTGYGRAYMEALFGEWGVVDVEDAVGAARFLTEQGLANPDKIAIMGGSAGGYTVLQTLVTHPGVFKAGVCLYGISDLFALQMGTHKFEAHYNDTLIGILPEAADLFRERSPLYSADAIEDALAIYHGAKDKVVPIDQAEAIVKSLRSRGVEHLYHVYEEEGHGWRRSETIVHFHESVLEFLTKNMVFG